MSVYLNGMAVCSVVWAMRAGIAVPLWPVLVPAAAAYGWARVSAAFREDLDA